MAALVMVGSACAGRRPGGPGVIHHVRAGENLYRIGLRYRVPPKAIARANGIHDVTTLQVGQRLFIPGARHRLEPSDAPAVAARPPRTPIGRGSPGVARSGPADEGSLRFLWPVRGRLSSGYGMRRGRPHEGIDLAAPAGTPIHAAESGRVIHSGRLGSYGNVVIVKHVGAYRTVYAHARKLYVHEGDFVERGQKLAEVGSTGRSSGPHLHFEIRRATSPRDPLAFLSRSGR
jgi:LysM repeat protein